MTRPSLEEIRRLAEAATKGPWKLETGVYQDLDGDDDIAFARGPFTTRDPGDGWDGRWRRQAAADAAYIASVSPPVVLALLDELEALRKSEEAIRRILENQPLGHGQEDATTRDCLCRWCILWRTLTKLDSLRGAGKADQ